MYLKNIFKNKKLRFSGLRDKIACTFLLFLDKFNAKRGGIGIVYILMDIRTELVLL